MTKKEFIKKLEKGKFKTLEEAHNALDNLSEHIGFEFNELSDMVESYFIDEEEGE